MRDLPRFDIMHPLNTQKAISEKKKKTLVIWNFEKKVPEIVAKMRLFMIAEI